MVVWNPGSNDPATHLTTAQGLCLFDVLSELGWLELCWLKQGNCPDFH